jgi:hypothetical protein
MIESAVHFNTNATIMCDSVHDALIHEFKYTLGGRFQFCLKLPTQTKRRWIVFNDVSAIGFKDLVQGTIVSDIFSWRLSASRKGELVPVAAWRVLLGENVREDKFSQLVASLSERHVSESLVFIESSYGGSIAAICSEVLTAEE